MTSIQVLTRSVFQSLLDHHIDMTGEFFNDEYWIYTRTIDSLMRGFRPDEILRRHSEIIEDPSRGDEVYVWCSNLDAIGTVSLTDYEVKFLYVHDAVDLVRLVELSKLCPRLKYLTIRPREDSKRVCLPWSLSHLRLLRNIDLEFIGLQKSESTLEYLYDERSDLDDFEYQRDLTQAPGSNLKYLAASLGDILDGYHMYSQIEHLKVIGDILEGDDGELDPVTSKSTYPNLRALEGESWELSVEFDDVDDLEYLSIEMHSGQWTDKFVTVDSENIKRLRVRSDDRLNLTINEPIETAFVDCNELTMRTSEEDHMDLRLRLSLIDEMPDYDTDDIRFRLDDTRILLKRPGILMDIFKGDPVWTRTDLRVDHVRPGDYSGTLEDLYQIVRVVGRGGQYSRLLDRLTEETTRALDASGSMM